MQNVKNWWQSKTIWFNVLMTLCAFVEANSAALRGIVGEQVMPYLLLTATFGNVVLRFYTSLPINTPPLDDDHGNS